MDNDKEHNLRQLIESIDDGLTENTENPVKAAVQEHRKREQIKNMALPSLWTQDELYEKKVIFTGMRQRDLLNSFREIRIKLLHKSKSDNIVVLVASVSNEGGSSFVGFNLAATFALDQQKNRALCGLQSLFFCRRPLHSHASRIGFNALPNRFFGST